MTGLEEILQFQFEKELRETAARVLRDDIDAENYVSVTLDEMYTADDRLYRSGDGTARHHEIGAYCTRDGNPVTVRADCRAGVVCVAEAELT